MNKVQEKQYELLCEFDRICKKYNIEYFLDGGTLLGAVRHNGFIPWDDDLDIGMSRKNYEKFKKVVSKELNERYFFQDINSDADFGFIFSKLRINNTIYVERISINNKAHNGIFIDIFPFDNVSDDEKIRKKDFMKVVILRMILLLKQNYIIETDTIGKKIEKIILMILSIFISKKHLLKSINKIINKYNDIETEYISNFSTPYFNKSIFPKKWFKEKIELKFEDGKFMCPKEYDSYLSYLYNDYMTLPPIEKRRNHGIIKVQFENEQEHNIED